MTQASAHRQRTVFFGAVLGLAASAMLFAALLFGCLYLRARGLADSMAPGSVRALAVVAWFLSVAAILLARARAFSRWGSVVLVSCALTAEISLLARLVTSGFASAGTYATLLSVTIAVFLVHAIGAVVALVRAPGTIAWTYLAGVWTLLTLLLVWR